MSTTTHPTSRARIRPVALPAEHGGWGFLFEPIVLGLLVAPSAAGLSLAFAIVGMFLARHPFKMAVADHRRGRRFARTRLAERFVALYAAIALAGFAVAIRLDGWHVVQPLLLAAPLFAVQILFDYRNESRHWLPELGGPIALAATGAAITLAGGWDLLSGLALASILVARSVPSVLYVRARLRLERGTQPSLVPALLAHAAALVIMALFAVERYIPLLAIIPFVVLLARAGYGLSKFRKPIAAKTVGFQELGLGLLTVVVAAAGYWLHI